MVWGWEIKDEKTKREGKDLTVEEDNGDDEWKRGEDRDSGMVTTALSADTSWRSP